jgi:predicted nucleic acid-binding protein
VIRSLIDTNILVYREDPRNPVKQAIATDTLKRAAREQSAAVAHQALIEAYAALIRPRADLDGEALLSPAEAAWVVSATMREFPILWPDAAVVKAALYGATMLHLSWYDAHMWAYAATNGIPELTTEDFEHGRYYDDVRAFNPFLQALGGVHELPPMFA